MNLPQRRDTARKRVTVKRYVSAATHLLFHSDADPAAVTVLQTVLFWTHLTPVFMLHLRLEGINLQQSFVSFQVYSLNI